MSGRYEPLARAIRRAAADQDLTRSDIAQSMNLSHTTVGEWFSGKRTPSRDQLVKLEKILKVESGTLCVLAGHLPEGHNPTIERTADEVIVRLSTFGGVEVVPIIHGPSSWAAKGFLDSRRHWVEAA